MGYLWSNRIATHKTLVFIKADRQKSLLQTQTSLRQITPKIYSATIKIFSKFARPKHQTKPKNMPTSHWTTKMHENRFQLRWRIRWQLLRINRKVLIHHRTRNMQLSHQRFSAVSRNRNTHLQTWTRCH